MATFRALKSTRYANRRLEAGDQFEILSTEDMRVMAAIGAAELVDPDETGVHPAVKRGRGRPRKHPLTPAELARRAQAAAPPPAPVPEPQIVEPTVVAAEASSEGSAEPEGSRTYQRRDMVAEQP